MNVYYIAGFPVSDELYHFGIPKMEWHKRRFQNYDGSLTDAGYERYYGHPRRKKGNVEVSDTGTGNAKAGAEAGRKATKLKNEVMKVLNDVKPTDSLYNVNERLKNNKEIKKAASQMKAYAKEVAKTDKEARKAEYDFYTNKSLRDKYSRIALDINVKNGLLNIDGMTYKDALEWFKEEIDDSYFDGVYASSFNEFRKSNEPSAKIANAAFRRNSEAHDSLEKATQNYADEILKESKDFPVRLVTALYGEKELTARKIVGNALRDRALKDYGDYWFL